MKTRFQLILKKNCLNSLRLTFQQERLNTTQPRLIFLLHLWYQRRLNRINVGVLYSLVNDSVNISRILNTKS